MRALAILAVLAVGCGAQPRESARMEAAASPDEAGAAPSAAAGQSAHAGGGEGRSGVPSADALRQKIIYTATVELVVEDFAPATAEVEALAAKFGGYVSNSNILGSPGSPRSGQWTIRVPVQRYQECLDAARGLGEVRAERADSQDVSEEYYDLEARIRNKKQEEERLLKLLEDATGKLEEVLAVERELARVRGEIEQMEGRVRVLDNLTELSTIHLEINEVRNYVPEEAATYGTRVRRALGNSVDSLAATGQNVSIAIVAASPWAGVLLVPVVLLAVLLRRLCRCRR